MRVEDIQAAIRQVIQADPDGHLHPTVIVDKAVNVLVEQTWGSGIDANILEVEVAAEAARMLRQGAMVESQPPTAAAPWGANPGQGNGAAHMDADRYQQLAARTLIDSPDFAITDAQVMLVWNATGLAGETGEVVDHIKKGIFHQRGIDRETVKRELGDVAWYLAALCTCLGLTMSEVMQTNVDKLRARYPDGYSPERSTVREGGAA